MNSTSDTNPRITAEGRAKSDPKVRQAAPQAEAASEITAVVRRPSTDNMPAVDFGEAEPASPPPVKGVGETNTGKVRQLNEDAFLVDNDLGLYVVCDGLGGHAAGEVASLAAINSVQSTLRAHRFLMEQYNREPIETHYNALAGVVQDAIVKANQEIHAVGIKDASKAGMGTTLILLLCLRDGALLANVGDSRAYVVRDGHVVQLSEDHSLVQEMVRRGMITAEEADSSKQKNVLLRALGVNPEALADIQFIRYRPGDLFILASDGFHGYLGNRRELQILVESFTWEDLPSRAIDLANYRGGKDNITVVAVKVLAGASLKPVAAA